MRMVVLLITFCFAANVFATHSWEYTQEKEN